MKVILFTLITHFPDPFTGVKSSAHHRLHEVAEHAVLAEELGFDGFAVGERHERPFLASAPTVVLGNIAARTSTIRLFTAVTTLSLIDPVRAFEDYSTLDHLSDGRLELMIGKGNGAPQRALFAVTPQDQWERNREGYEVFRQLWDSDRVTWSGRYRPALEEAEALPRPLQQPIRVWHGSATSKDSVELAAKYGDPLFSANVTNPIEPYAELIRYYRERWVAYGRDPKDALVGAGTAGFHVARTSQEALDTYRPIFSSRLKWLADAGVDPVFATLEDFVERSSALIGSPAQIIEKVLRYHQQFGHEVITITSDRDGLTPEQHRAALELFQGEVAPVLRREIPSRPFAGPIPVPPATEPDSRRPIDIRIG